MSEFLTIQVGEGANYIDSHFWSALARTAAPEQYHLYFNDVKGAWELRLFLVGASMGVAEEAAPAIPPNPNTQVCETDAPLAIHPLRRQLRAGEVSPEFDFELLNERAISHCSDFWELPSLTEGFWFQNEPVLAEAQLDDSRLRKLLEQTDSAASSSVRLLVDSAMAGHAMAWRITCACLDTGDLINVGMVLNEV